MIVNKLKMKKLIFFCLTALIMSCKEDADMPALNFDFNIKTEIDNFSDKGVNEVVKIPFEISSQYDFEKIPLKYKIESSLKCDISDGTKKILKGDAYTLTKPNLELQYTGKEKGDHKIKITFSNSKGKVVVKDFSLNYKEYGYTLEVLNGNANPFQGENVDFDIKITPENKANPYYIVFKSYDPEDPNLQKTLISLNGNKIAFGKEYKIDDFNNLKVRINSFYAGTKHLKYVIKNKTHEREESIRQNVNKNTIIIQETSVTKSLIENINETTTFKAKIIKTPKFSNKLQYKTSLIEGKTGLTTNDWKDITLQENGEVSFPIKALEVGTYTYEVIFRDEFGNETENNSAFNKNISVKTPEEFEIEFSSSAKKIIETKPFPFEIKIRTKNPHHSSVSYTAVFKNMTVEYDEKIYNAGEEIVIKTDKKEGDKTIIFNGIGIFKENTIVQDYIEYSDFQIRTSSEDNIVVIKNTDKKEKSLKWDFLKNPDILVPFVPYEIYLQFDYWEYDHEKILGVVTNRHRKGVVWAKTPRQDMDSFLNEDKIEYHFFLEKKGIGMRLIGSASYKSLLSINDRKVIMEDFDDPGPESPNIDHMRIEVHYHNKKIAELNGIRGFWYDKDQPIRIKNLRGISYKIHFENYPNPAEDALNASKVKKVK